MSSPAGADGETARRVDAKAGVFAHDGVFWRKLARLGAAHGPKWWVEYMPPAFGIAAALALPSKRHSIRDNLRRIRGRVGALQEVREIAETFTTYAGCLAEVLSNGSKNASLADLEVRGKPHMDRALLEKKGVIVVTAHTAGWEVAGPLFKEHRGMDLVMVMEAERDGAARALQDDARRAIGLSVAHVGEDAFSALPVLRKLREGAAVALQIDRKPPGMRGIAVRMFDESHEIPEGPLRLAQLSGAPIVPMFCARLGYRDYFAEIYEPIFVPRRPEPGVLDMRAQQIGDALTDFVRRYPTQWFHFVEKPTASRKTSRSKPAA